MRGSVHGPRTGGRRSEKVRRDHGGHDRAAEVWQRDAVLPVGEAGTFTGDSLPASTQWEIVEEAAEVIQTARDELIRQAAQGEVLHNDDTSMRVLHLAREPSGDRTGVFTSGIVSTQPGQRIALYFTGRQHAEENLRDVLQRRVAELGAPIQMGRRPISRYENGFSPR